MFCKKCGTQIADDARFCTNCGAATDASAAPVNNQPVYTVPKVAEPNPMFANFLSVLKSFWKSPTAVVANAAKSNTYEWILLMTAGILTYALGAAVVGLEMLSQLLGSLLGGFSSYVYWGDYYPFFAMFLVSILVGSAAYGLTALGVWLLVAKIFKKNATFIQALNMVAVATLPLAAIHTFNMLAGLVYAPLTIAFMIIALVISSVLLYVGVQKFDKLEKSPFYGYTIVMTAVICAVFVLGLISISIVGNSLTGMIGL